MRMRKHWIVAVIVGLMEAGGPVHAQSSTAPDAGMLALFDTSETSSNDGHGCTVVMTLNKDQAIGDIQKFQNNMVLNTNFPADFYSANPAALVTVVSMEAAAVGTEQFFQGNDKTPSCRFTYNISYSDEYGNPKTDLLFSYNFTDTIYHKINWDNFSPANLPKVSSNYSSSQLYQAMMVMAEQAISSVGQ